MTMFHPARSTIVESVNKIVKCFENPSKLKKVTIHDSQLSYKTHDDNSQLSYESDDEREVVDFLNEGFGFGPNVEKLEL